VTGAAPPYLLVINPKLPVTSTADLVRLAKQRPDGLTTAVRIWRRRCRPAWSSHAADDRWNQPFCDPSH
jgi:hypothetical protein